MKSFLAASALFLALCFLSQNAFAEIKYVNGYTKSNGSYVSGHYKDTSGDGNSYNNANSLGLNG